MRFVSDVVGQDEIDYFVGQLNSWNWIDVGEAAAGVLLGALLAFASAWWIQRRQEKREAERHESGVAAEQSRLNREAVIAIAAYPQPERARAWLEWGFYAHHQRSHPETLHIAFPEPPEYVTLLGPKLFLSEFALTTKGPVHDLVMELIFELNKPLYDRETDRLGNVFNAFNMVAMRHYINGEEIDLGRFLSNIPDKSLVEQSCSLCIQGASISP